MPSNCSEFNFLIDRKSIYTTNDIPSIIAYNKCLTNEINELASKTNSLENQLDINQQKLSRLSTKVSDQKEFLDNNMVQLSESIDVKVGNLKATQQQNVDNFSSMFQAVQTGYADHLTAISFILGCAGIFFFIGLGIYKKREINQLKDETLEQVRSTLETEGLVINLVERALTESTVTDLVDTRLNTIAEGLEQQIITRINDVRLYNQPPSSNDDQLSDIIQ